MHRSIIMIVSLQRSGNIIFSLVQNLYNILDAKQWRCKCAILKCMLVAWCADVLINWLIKHIYSYNGVFGMKRQFVKIKAEYIPGLISHIYQDKSIISIKWDATALFCPSHCQQIGAYLEKTFSSTRSDSTVMSGKSTCCCRSWALCGNESLMLSQFTKDITVLKQEALQIRDQRRGLWHSTIARLGVAS